MMSNAKKDEFVDVETTEAPEAGFGEEGAGYTPDESDPVTALLDEVEQLRAERDDMRDRFMRALADAENARKRGDRDRREAETYGGAKFARDMLPVYDNLKRAIDAVPEDKRAEVASLLEGVELTLRELLNIFGRHGITRIAPEPGDPFDPQMHQAMFEAPVPEIKGGCIIQVMTEGFQMHDRLLRPAQVGVSSSPKS
jgi:molecular chaperone GrpE